MKLLIEFSIPILIGNLFQQAYTLADRIIVGRFVGDTAFSAIGTGVAVCRSCATCLTVRAIPCTH